MVHTFNPTTEAETEMQRQEDLGESEAICSTVLSQSQLHIETQKGGVSVGRVPKSVENTQVPFSPL